MKKKIKISFIGCGFMSQIAHICNFHRDKRVELFDVADFDLKMAQGVKKKFGFKGIATNNADKVIRKARWDSYNSPKTVNDKFNQKKF